MGCYPILPRIMWKGSLLLLLPGNPVLNVNMRAGELLYNNPFFTFLLRLYHKKI